VAQHVAQQQHAVQQHAAQHHMCVMQSQMPFGRQVLDLQQVVVQRPQMVQQQVVLQQHAAHAQISPQMVPQLAQQLPPHPLPQPPQQLLPPTQPVAFPQKVKYETEQMGAQEDAHMPAAMKSVVRRAGDVDEEAGGGSASEQACASILLQWRQGSQMRSDGVSAA